MQASRIVAALGPTNTGKTHRAVERMLEHTSGMLGFPLRLLAREVYERVTRVVGENRVALITGEEKRIPRQPCYWICTVEAMPLERSVDFMAIDEIQLATHRERGHVFTDRLLNARGRRETWFMGASTLRPLLQKLVPTAELHRYPRLSKLSAAGTYSLSALPPRSAVVGFSAARVYELAERVRRRRGGAAVVLGALSPRARNAQVAMYQAREVDYLVATDAIGMGLNLDVDRIAFADLRKFDGREARSLDAAELAQIAGRAGRYQNAGSFGTLAPLPPLPTELARSIERHQFPEDRRLVYRNSTLDTESIDRLLASLRQKPPHPALDLIEFAEDYEALCKLSAMPEIRRIAQSPERVALLWEVCQIPDYRKLMLDQHVKLLAELYRQLSSGSAVDSDWLMRTIVRIDNPAGDIETLMARMAAIRTWTYVSQRDSWLKDAPYWQEYTRAIEDRLSDALHQALVARFIDVRKKSSSARSFAERGAQRAGKAHPFAQLLELRQALEGPNESPHSPVAWVEKIIEAPFEAINVDSRGNLVFENTSIASLTRGADLARPEIKLHQPNAFGAGARARLTRRLVAWTRDWVDSLFGTLKAAPEASPAARGLLYELSRSLGSVARRTIQGNPDALASEERGQLERAGLVFGKHSVFVRQALGETALEQRWLLWRTYTKLPAAASKHEPPRGFGAPSLTTPPGLDSADLMALGYQKLGPRAVRVDVAERLAQAIQASKPPPLRVLASYLGCSVAEARPTFRALGIRLPKSHRSKRARSRRKSAGPTRSLPQSPSDPTAPPRG